MSADGERVMSNAACLIAAELPHRQGPPPCHQAPAGPGRLGGLAVGPAIQHADQAGRCSCPAGLVVNRSLRWPAARRHAGGWVRVLARFEHGRAPGHRLPRRRLHRQRPHLRRHLRRGRRTLLPALQGLAHAGRFAVVAAGPARAGYRGSSGRTGMSPTIGAARSRRSGGSRRGGRRGVQVAGLRPMRGLRTPVHHRGRRRGDRVPRRPPRRGTGVRRRPSVDRHPILARCRPPGRPCGFHGFTGAAGGLASPLTAHAHAGGEVVDPGPGPGRVPELRRAGGRPLPGGADGRGRAGRQPWRAGVGRGVVAGCPAV